MASFVQGQRCVSVIAIVTCECAILILQKLRLRVCHFCYCLLIYNDYVILSCFILNWPMLQWCNGAMVQWCNGAMVICWNGAMVRWYNGEIKIRISCFISNKYWICSFVLFLKTTFLQQTKQSIIFNIWSQKQITATKFKLSNQATTERYNFIRGQPIVVREIVNQI